ncbi:MAG: hypothetical protein R3C11_11525 [Planctomycetaceae bacterium]
MAYRQIKDIVRVIKDKHEEVEDALEAASDKVHCPKAKALISRMQRDEQEMEMIMCRSLRMGRNAGDEYLASIYPR